MNLEMAYNNLTRDPLFAFVVLPSGTVRIIQGAQSPFAHDEIHIFPGSYNPIHDAHRLIYQNIDCPPDGKFYEISIERVSKEFLPLHAEANGQNHFNSLSARLKQFHGSAPVIVTRAPRFIEKAGLFRYHSPVFHIGADTVLRMLDDYGIAGAQGIAARFIVYDRKIDGEIVGLRNVSQVPMNFKPGKTPNESLLGLSSTQIRREWVSPQVQNDGATIDGSQKKA